MMKTIIAHAISALALSLVVVEKSHPSGISPFCNNLDRKLKNVRKIVARDR